MKLLNNQQTWPLAFWFEPSSLFGSSKITMLMGFAYADLTIIPSATSALRLADVVLLRSVTMNTHGYIVLRALHLGITAIAHLSRELLVRQ